ncbi:regulator of g protein signaling [Anaeramoeba flamelloides]|uniref:Regulator of g protein signaling n=1 Tax=Anaeramoeba flamelloides TaxID=1746091 RepID=A0ABQ8YB45_9EUKA|nr:regulator of g protein signaling [Anaeramoeba flamelloides]
MSFNNNLGLKMAKNIISDSPSKMILQPTNSIKKKKNEKDLPHTPISRPLHQKKTLTSLKKQKLKVLQNQNQNLTPSLHQLISFDDIEIFPLSGEKPLDRKRKNQEKSSKSLDSPQLDNKRDERLHKLFSLAMREVQSEKKRSRLNLEKKQVSGKGKSKMRRKSKGKGKENLKNPEKMFHKTPEKQPKRGKSGFKEIKDQFMISHTPQKRSANLSSKSPSQNLFPKFWKSKNKPNENSVQQNNSPRRVSEMPRNVCKKSFNKDYEHILELSKNQRSRIGGLNTNKSKNTNTNTNKRTLLSEKEQKEMVYSLIPNLETLFLQKNGIKYFTEFVESELSSENIEFYLAVENIKLIKERDQFKKEAENIFNTYIKPNSMQEINIQSSIRKKIIEEAEMNFFTPHTFDQAQNSIWNLMANDSFQRFFSHNAAYQLYKEIKNINGTLRFKTRRHKRQKSYV